MTTTATDAAVTAAAQRFRLRVYWEDTDAAGIVYYANFLKFFERARSEMVEAAGIDQSVLLAEQGIVFPVRRCEIDYLAPARLGDELDVHTTVRAVGGATIDLDQDVTRADAVLARGRIRLACTGRSGRPQRLPAPVRAALTPMTIRSC